MSCGEKFLEGPVWKSNVRWRFFDENPNRLSAEGENFLPISPVLSREFGTGVLNKNPEAHFVRRFCRAHHSPLKHELPMLAEPMPVHVSPDSTDERVYARSGFFTALGLLSNNRCVNSSYALNGYEGDVFSE